MNKKNYIFILFVIIIFQQSMDKPCMRCKLHFLVEKFVVGECNRYIEAHICGIMINKVIKPLKFSKSRLKKDYNMSNV